MQPATALGACVSAYAQGALKPVEAMIVNPPTRPVPVTMTQGVNIGGTVNVRNVDEQGRSPYAETFSMVQMDQGCSTTAAGGLRPSTRYIGGAHAGSVRPIRTSCALALDQFGPGLCHQGRSMTLLAAKAKAQRAAASARQDSHLALAELADAIAEMARSIREELDDLKQRLDIVAPRLDDDDAPDGRSNVSLNLFSDSQR